MQLVLKLSVIKKIHSYIRVFVRSIGGNRWVKYIWRYRLYISFVLAGLVWLAIFIAIYTPQTIMYDFGKSATCQKSPRLLPGLSTLSRSSTFRLTRTNDVSIGSFRIYSAYMCATANKVPKARAQATYNERLFGLQILQRAVHIQTTDYPALRTPSAEPQTVPPDGTLKVPLDTADATFAYVAIVEGRTAPCKLQNKTIDCGLEQLQLAYAHEYSVQLRRNFKGAGPSDVGAIPIQTITPTGVVTTSITAGAQVQQKPTEVVIQTDKKLTAVGDVVLMIKNPDGTEKSLPATAKMADTAVTVVFGQELPRKASFEVRIASVTAQDGSGFVGKSFSLPFTTSGGPKVTGTSIGTRNVSTTPTIGVNFDQPLLTTQNNSDVVSFTAQGKGYPITLAATGNKITIVPQGALPLCASFSIKITPQVQNAYGVSGDSAWTFSGRTICYTTFSIGSSVKGRGITAYQFGTGPNPIVYMGAMHGSEANSKTLMNEWFNELNANPTKLGGRSLVVIPAVNPDGVAAGSRLNARGVDLNRNFPASDWKSMVTSPESPQPTAAGGPYPLSEPESSAIASYIQRVRPRVVFSFHSAAAVVEANEAGDSVSIASIYASAARYRAVPKSQSTPIFQYDTTGAMEDWMRDKLGSPAVVVELLSKTSSEFSRNRSALWGTVGL